MQDSLRMGKRALTIAVAAATILWSIGFSAFVAPLTARAAAAGDLVKGTTLSTLYYYAADGKRYAFPNEKTYMTWYADFSGVQTLSDSALAALPLGGNVVYRPGAHWVKIQSDPKTYAVTPSGQLRWIESEAVASGLAGSDWNKFIDDVPDVFFVDFTVGTSLTSAASAYNGALVKASDGTNYLVWNGEKRLVSSAGFTANRFQTRNLLDGTGVSLSGITSGSEVAAQEATFVNTAQTAQSVTTTTGGLTVSLASDSPAAMTVPSQATSITMMKFNLVASSGSVTVSSITLKQGGVGATTTMSNVYLYEGSTRLANGRSLNSSTREATYTGLGLSLAAGQTKTLSVVVDMADNTSGGDTIQFELAAASAVVSTATVSGSFPVRGSVMTTSATDVGTVTIAKSGTITNPILGAKAAKIAEFKLTAGSSEGIKIERLRLDVRDASKHKNFVLKQNNGLVANGVVASSDKVDFTFTKPFEIAQGNDKIFEVFADVGGENNDTVKVALEENADLYAVGAKYGFGVAVTKTDYDEPGSACAATSDDCSRSTIQGGKLTIAYNGPAKFKFKPDMSGVVIWEATITSQNVIQIRDFDFTIDGSDLAGSAEANFQNFRLVDKATGSTIAGPEEFDDALASISNTDERVSFIDDWNMSAGQSIDLQLKVDVKGTSGSYDVADADTITAEWENAGISARDINNDDLTVGTDIIPATDLTGNAHEVDTSALTVAVSQPPASATFVKGASGVEVVGFSWTAGSASSAKLSALTLGGGGEDTIAAPQSYTLNPTTYISSCSLYDGTTGGLIDGPESFTGTFSSGSAMDVAFSGFSWTIPAGQTYKMIAKCNFANVDPASSTNDGWSLEINSESDITAVDDDGDSIATNGTDAASLTINTTGAILQTIASSGSLAVAAAGDTPKAAIVLGESTSVEVAKFKVTASTESFLIRKLTIQNDGATNVPGVTSVMLEYKDKAGATKTQTGILDSNAKITYELPSGSELYAAKDADTVFSVKVNTGEVTNDNTVSGDALDLEWQFAAATNDNEFEAVGLSSGATITDNDSTLSGYTNGTGDDDFVAVNAHTMRKTKPTLALASGSPSGAGIPGLGEVMRFSVAADSRGQIVVRELTFKITSTDNNGDSSNDWNECGDGSTTGLITTADFTLYDASNVGTAIEGADTDWTLLEDDGSACTTGTDDVAYVILDLTTNETIGAGSTKTYSLYVDTTGASASNDDSLRVDLPVDDSGANVDGLNLAGSAAGVSGSDDGTILWDDGNLTSAGAREIDGYLVKNLPVTGGTLVY